MRPQRRDRSHLSPKRTNSTNSQQSSTTLTSICCAYYSTVTWHYRSPWDVQFLALLALLRIGKPSKTDHLAFRRAGKMVRKHLAVPKKQTNGVQWLPLALVLRAARNKTVHRDGSSTLRRQSEPCRNRERVLLRVYGLQYSFRRSDLCPGVLEPEPAYCNIWRATASGRR